MSTEIDEILQSRGKIEKFKPKFLKIIGGLFFSFGCIVYTYGLIRDWDSNDVTAGLFPISLGVFWFIIFIITKQSKVNLELIDRIQEIEDRSKIKNSDS